MRLSPNVLIESVGDETMNVIPDKQRTFFDQSSNPCHFTDTEHRIIYANAMWYKWQDLEKKRFNVEDRYFSEIPSKAFISCCDKFEFRDKKSLRTGKPQTTLEIHEWKEINGYRVCLVTTKPWLDENGHIIGQMAVGRHLNNAPLSRSKKLKRIIDFNIFENKNKEASIIMENPDKLNDVQFETVYLLALGYTPKQIAYERQIKVTAVNKTLNILRFKLGVTKNEELIDLAHANDWLNYLPASFRGYELSLPLDHIKADEDDWS